MRTRIFNILLFAIDKQAKFGVYLNEKGAVAYSHFKSNEYATTINMENMDQQNVQGTVQPPVQGYTIPPIQQPKPTKKRSPIWIILTIVFALAVIGLSVLCVMEFRKTQELSAECDARAAQITEKDATIETRDATIASLKTDVETGAATAAEQEEAITGYKKTIQSLRNEMLPYKADSEELNDVYTFLLRADAGQASNNFKADKSIIVMHKSDPMTSLRLTTGYTTSYGFTYSKYGVATVEFNKNSWSSTSTQINVTPTGVGTTIVTFVNKLNSETFKVMLVVLD